MQSRRNSKGSHGRWVVATMCTVTLVLSALVAPAATAGPVADSGTAADAPQIVSSAQLLSAFDGAQDTQAVVDYWTGERMAEAQPIPLPEVPVTGGVTPPVGVGDGPSASGAVPTDHVAHTDYLPPDQLDSHPHASVGKVFLTLNGFDFVCSAAAVTTEGRWGAGSGGLVATAGHCVSSGNGQFVSRLMFVPGYDEGAEPFGRWQATNVFTTNAWHNGGGRGYSQDVAFARVIGTGEHADARLSDVVEPLGLAFTETYPEDGFDVAVEPAVGNAYASFGYGVERWGGERPVRSVSSVVALDPNFSPNPQGIDSNHTGGSSGGPWLHNYAPGADEAGLNLINSVNSYVYRGFPIIYGPRFDEHIHSLWTGSNRPAITIDDVAVVEGDSGTTATTFTVSLDAAGPEQITVHWVTEDGTAEADIDYTDGDGTLTFEPGQTSLEVTVDVIGDTLDEDDEAFAVLLSGPPNAILRDGTGTGTILDDDPKALSIGDATVTEGDAGTTTATFPVSLDSASDLPVTVDWVTDDGTAEAGSDYIAGSGTLTFEPGQTSLEVTVDVIGDILDEADEDFFVDLSNPTNAILRDGTGVGTILDDDRKTLSIGDAAVTEGDAGTTTATFPVTLDPASDLTVTVDWTTADFFSAEAGSDYIAGSGTLTFPPSQTAQQVTVEVIGDTLDEGDEDFFVVLSNATNAAVTDDFSGFGTIVDDDPALSIGPATVTEGDDGTVAATFPVSLATTSRRRIFINWATADGTAEAGSDYIAGSGALTFVPGQTAQHVSVGVIGDVIVEADETFTVDLSYPANPSVVEVSGVGTIIDDDVLPALSIGPATVTEGDDGTTPATFPVTLDAASVLPITVDWATADGTAEAGSDYTAGSGTLTFPPGQTSQEVTVDVIGDTVDEADETFTVDLASPTNSTLSTDAATGTIVDDDEPAPSGGGSGGGVPSPSQPEPDGSVTQQAGAGGTVSAAGGPGGASVTTPNAGTVTILVRQADDAAPDGFTYLPVAIDITAPTASAEDPLVLVFTLDADNLPDGTEVGDIVVFRDGVALDDCAGATSGGPCVSQRGVDSETGEVTFRVVTPAASTWNFGLAQAQPDPEPVEPVRLSGEDNVAAAIAWSRFGFDDGSAATVLLGRDDVFADSLASGPVQGVAGAPLLLTSSDALDDRTAEELRRLGARTVVILGGTTAVSAQVEAELAALGYAVERVSGAERLSTAAALAERFFAEAASAIVARADGDVDDPTRAFADSLGAGALGAATGQPVLLTDSDGLSQATAAYLASSSITSVTIAGGTAAVSDQVAADLTALGISVERASGPNRFATAAALAARGGHQQPTGVLVVDGSGADAWASGFAAASQATTAPLLLTDGPRVPAETIHALGDMSGSQLTCGPYVAAGACTQAVAALAPTALE